MTVKPPSISIMLLAADTGIEKVWLDSSIGEPPGVKVVPAAARPFEIPVNVTPSMAYSVVSILVSGSDCPDASPTPAVPEDEGFGTAIVDPFEKSVPEVGD